MASSDNNPNSPVYDSIGQTYTATRAADPRIVDRLLKELDLSVPSSILDVGAGSGNYSQAVAEAGHHVTAVEPSQVMRDQGQPHARLRWVDGSAEDLPFEDGVFDGVMMTLCMHHFADWRLALTEACRVAGMGPIVIFTFDAEANKPFWLLDYFPAFRIKDRDWFPKLGEIEGFVRESLKRSMKFEAMDLPPDLIDHFAAAGWARPEIYLDERYRAGISSFSCVDQADEIAEGLAKLASDLASGCWDEQYGDYRRVSCVDVGYVFLKIFISSQA